ncbi:hypothetical protein A3G67_03760 [Candidatus Roizmanbacteria bacterium RIFCSPLOWO2_12_FULL_40_12]|uniref:Uncharacterized protein n=1 Tax=Candidatus Roizmanbacteria bacterium RIFCSPLOWO2_01_FULL_40_42 TaxID=1802066 RepID=A0A1F7J5Q6_9BACT|nr:MAG: hypothetical protein A2779_03395 [Candidatus Roizmanbacteria bacterium RIFCSPHIGHO2_01_FULL_40_98]OGK28381.1 MAG: hypothetical protein A3C31_00760 [Candidatus Roizmanbacteria bacterium RIFCSPHIGHO2_02_FULL_40_53]OGK30617.1 MAG: hypothetical protein A2W49_03445 [Candidatus Roizmanbacteria bacterium RIFCSPHIGHO2_12_41_18]OGK37031.1 MAG: hypothetical protein A3E69_01020 [Candidatus Roizmanbacteria bacterium RIFCSPHIGHO2_12_FULL_40_130]OGK50937.1 MAG: hypothetical protein A3B50_01530 [Candi
MSVLYVKHQRAQGSGPSFFQHLTAKKHSKFFVFFGLFLALSVFLLNIAVKTAFKQTPKFAQIERDLSFETVNGVAAPEVLGVNEANPPPAPQENTPTPTPTKKLSKSYYTVTVFGDSMVDTMGERMEYLEGALKKKYPDTTFFLYNYGIGSQNVEDGLARYNNDFKYQDRNFPAISKIQADVIIIGSFAYNPFSPHSRDRHWLGLTRLVQEAVKRKDAEVYMLAETAPLRRQFGKGPGGVNWDTDTSYKHSGYIVEQLENVIGLAKSLNVPLIDVYHKSLANESLGEGKREFVNSHDGIHPSVEGHKFMAEYIANSLNLE